LKKSSINKLIPLHQHNSTAATQKIWDILATVCDPEVPVLTILDLGIARDVSISNDEVRVTVTPTYTGCPAMDMISMNIRFALAEHGYKNIKIIPVLSPVWTTDWMSEAGKAKLLQYGIAPPKGSAGAIPADGIECPQCHSNHTKLLSEFGSTACKALYQCQDCKEPFDYFKCH
jgi:ring-1,2-phenylacetyl-CoA epoxidase subunit PaaD